MTPFDRILDGSLFQKDLKAHSPEPGVGEARAQKHHKPLQLPSPASSTDYEEEGSGSRGGDGDGVVRYGEIHAKSMTMNMVDLIFDDNLRGPGFCSPSGCSMLACKPAPKY